jgi:uncharacterized glyoxalase superfamily protein PhnB
MPSPTMKKMSPVLFVEEIEPSLDFWARLGFERTVEVPDGERLGFVILAKDDVEVMYQSRASVRKDVPALASMPSCIALYVEVDDLDLVETCLAGATVVIERRKTFYGAEELGHSDGIATLLLGQDAAGTADRRQQFRLGDCSTRRADQRRKAGRLSSGPSDR